MLENQDTVSLCLTTSIGSDQLLSVIVSTAPKNATGLFYSLFNRMTYMSHCVYIFPKRIIFKE